MTEPMSSSSPSPPPPPPTDESTDYHGATVEEVAAAKEKLTIRIRDLCAQVASLNDNVGYRTIESEYVHAKQLRETLAALIFSAFTLVTPEQSDLLNRTYESAATIEKRLGWRAEAWRGIAAKDAQVKAQKNANK